MLQVKNISKKYITGDFEQMALDHVSLTLRDNEFVAVLGPSGSGKTTLLNIVGGLDRYDEGDLIINGVSTKQYRDRDWDAYRNHTIGFVFQSYNLIPHQSVLANVELALTIGNASADTKRKRAREALEKVGLGDQGHKRPNQLSGGQMQRVAIARALVNNPDIILADEPTGALDSKTSLQIMDLLKEVASDRLVVMVTHNPELANEYANRIIELKDGQIISDTNPVQNSELVTSQKKPPRSSLGFVAALSLSLNNLMTKKGRTFLTSFAGAIGIIGIAMILALSTGVNDYIKEREANILGTYPVELTKRTIDTTTMMDNRRQQVDKQKNKEDHSDEIVSSQIVADTVEATDEMIKSNDLGKFKTYLDKNKHQLDEHITAIEYSYDMQPMVYRKDKKEGIVKVSPSSLMQNNNMSGIYSGTLLANMMSSSISSEWQQLVSSETLRNNNYTLVAGKWPSKANEIALILDENNEISDYVLYNLGLLDISKMNKIIKAIEKGKDFDDPSKTFKYKDALGLSYRVFAPAELYTKKEGVYINRNDDDKYIAKHLKEGYKVTITCVLKGKHDSNVASGVGYTMALAQRLMTQTKQSAVVKEQVRDKNVNVLTGKKFKKAKDSKKTTTFRTSTRSILQGFDTPILTASAMHTPRYLLNEDDSSLVDDISDTSEIVDTGDTSEIEDERQTIVLPNGETITLPEGVRLPEGYEDMTTEELVDYLVAYLEENSTLSEEDIAALVEQITGGNTEMPSIDDLLTDEQIQAYIQAYIKEHPELVQDALEEYIKKYMEENGGGLTEKQLQEYLKKYLEENGAFSGMSMEDLMKEYMKRNGMSLEDYLKQYMAKYADQMMKNFDLSKLSKEQLAALMARYSTDIPNTYREVLDALHYYSVDEPSMISIYPIDFDSKDVVVDFISTYNKQVKKEADKVTYSDIIKSVTTSITDIINTITYILVAFVAISLVVSSIMIAIITYISVLERTKEIGVLRALGSTKNDISKIFNAETFIEGLISGLMGVGVTRLICLPVNKIVYEKLAVANIAKLPIIYGAILVLISVILTFIAGYIPSRIAAKKDPVTALRSE